MYITCSRSPAGKIMARNRQKHDTGRQTRLNSDGIPGAEKSAGGKLRNAGRGTRLRRMKYSAR
jgi:hypothetical protein